MKRSDLVVGQTYLVSQNTNWLEYSYGNSPTTLIDAGRWTYLRRWSRSTVETPGVELSDGTVLPSHIVRSSKGTAGVLMRKQDGTYDVVPALRIRDTWEQGSARVQAYNQQREDRKLAAQRLQQARDGHVGSLRARVEALGLDVNVWDLNLDQHGRITIKADLLEKLVTLVDGGE